MIPFHPPLQEKEGDHVGEIFVSEKKHTYVVGVTSGNGEYRPRLNS